MASLVNYDEHALEMHCSGGAAAAVYTFSTSGLWRTRQILDQTSAHLFALWCWILLLHRMLCTLSGKVRVSCVQIKVSCVFSLILCSSWRFVLGGEGWAVKHPTQKERAARWHWGVCLAIWSYRVYTAYICTSFQ